MFSVISKSSVILSSILALSVAHADKHDKNKKAAPTKAEAVAATFNVDTAATNLVWKGHKPAVAGSGHEGTIKVKSGALVVKNDEVTSGNVEIDMTTLEVTDLKGDKAQGLKGHLMSGDFFEVYEAPAKDAPKGTLGKPKYPTASLVITKVEKSTTPGSTHTVSGTITIKDKPNAISFPATISVTKDVLKAKGTLKIDRTKHDVKFGSTLAGAVGDKFIDDNFTVDVDLTAKK